jgi:hypothetical protein
MKTKILIVAITILSMGCYTVKTVTITRPYDDYLTPFSETIDGKTYITRCVCYPPDSLKGNPPIIPRTMEQVENFKTKGFKCMIVSTSITNQNK